jgi:hypothetical protein
MAIMTALLAAGYDLYLPFGENTRCDLVIDREEGLLKVQCKTGRLRDGAIRFPVCSTYVHHRNPRTPRRSYHGEVDAFAVFCPETNGVYLIPIDDLPVKSSAYLRVTPARNNQDSKVRPAARYAVARVATEVLREPSDASGSCA